MNKQSESDSEAQAKEESEAKTARLLALIFGGLIVALIAGMAAIDIYSDKLQGASSSVHDAAEP